jgi:hypothetical protein
VTGLLIKAGPKLTEQYIQDKKKSIDYFTITTGLVKLPMVDW